MQSKRANRKVDAVVERVSVWAYTVPTDQPESDGTLAWDSTTIVVVEATAADVRGLGYTYADTATAHLIKDRLIDIVQGRDCLAVQGSWLALLFALLLIKTGHL